MRKEELYTALESIIGSEVNDTTDLSNLVSGPNSTPLLELLPDKFGRGALWHKEEYLACCATAYQLYDIIHAWEIGARDAALKLHLHALRLSFVNKPSFFYEAVTPLVYPELDISCVNWPVISEETAWPSDDFNEYYASDALAVLLNNAGLVVPQQLYDDLTTVGDVYQVLHEYTCTHAEAWQEIKSFSTSPSFEKIRTKNRVYIDKGGLFNTFLNEDSFLFLARPRRFGKSVLLDMLSCLYSGNNAALFKGTELAQKAANIDPCHVIQMSWTEAIFETSVDPVLLLKKTIIQRLVKGLVAGARAGEGAEANNESDACAQAQAQAQFEEKHRKVLDAAKNLAKQSTIEEFEFTGIIVQLLEQCYDPARPFVLLIDEYDAPANEFLANSEILPQIMTVYRMFFGMIKLIAKLFSLVFITGISKFSDVGVFSGFNLRNDLSENQTYESIVGFSQLELYTGYFLHLAYIAQSLTLRYYPMAPSSSSQQTWLDLAANHSSLALLLSQLKHHYNGYSFGASCYDSGRVYNPWSVVNFIQYHEEIQGKYRPNTTIFTNSWVESGSFANSFFVHKMQSMATKSYEVRWKLLGLLSDLLSGGPYEIALDAINQSPHLYTDEQCVEFGASFLYRAGYLTWYDSKHLCIPNLEIRDALDALFTTCIKSWLAVSNSKIKDSDLLDSKGSAKNTSVLNLDNLKRFFNGILLCFSSSYLSTVSEHLIRDIILVALRNNPDLHAVYVIREEPVAGGRADLVIETDTTKPHQVHSIEFKLVDSKTAVDKAAAEAKKQVLTRQYSKHHIECDVFRYIAVFYNSAAKTTTGQTATDQTATDQTTTSKKRDASHVNQITCERLEPVDFHEVVGALVNSPKTATNKAESDSGSPVQQ